VLGSNAFVNWIYEQFLSKTKDSTRELTGLKELETGPGTIAQIAQQVSLEFEISAQELYQRRSAYRTARSIFMELCCFFLARKMSLAHIGRTLGDVSVSALTQNRKRLLLRMRDDSHLRYHFQKLIYTLKNSFS